MSALSSAPRVICLGEGLIDRIFHRFDEDHAGEPFWQDFPGGAPANVATGLVKLGTSAGFVGCVGKDSAGSHLLDTLVAAGVNCSQTQRHPSAPTRLVLVQRDRRGERHFVGFGQPQVDGYADTFLQSNQLNSAWFQPGSVLVMGTLGLAYPTTHATMKQALAWAQANQMKTAIDINWRPNFWPVPAVAAKHIQLFIAQADLVKMSNQEAQWLFQTEDTRQILSKLPMATAVVVTAGADGCRYATSEIHGTMGAFPVNCEDSTGAGDAFLSGLLHYLCEEGFESLHNASKFRQAIRYASAAGALTALRAGAMAVQPQAKEISAFLYLHPQTET